MACILLTLLLLRLASHVVSTSFIRCKERTRRRSSWKKRRRSELNKEGEDAVKHFLFLIHSPAGTVHSFGDSQFRAEIIFNPAIDGWIQKRSLCAGIDSCSGFLSLQQIIPGIKETLQSLGSHLFHSSIHRPLVHSSTCSPSPFLPPPFLSSSIFFLF